MRRQVLRGVAWQGSATLIARAARSLAWLVLGGLLTPAEFGAFAATYVIVDGMYLLQDLGLPQAFVVRRTRIEESANSTFLLAALSGMLFASIAWLVAPWVAAFYGDPALVLPFRVLGLVLVIHALRIVPLRLFERDLDFRRKLGPTTWGAVAYLVVSVGAAMAGLGIWSLVMAILVGATVETVGFWIISPWRPQNRFARDVVREDLLFGLPVVAGSVLVYAYSSLDRFVLGRFAGVETLGVYAFALSLAMMPSSVGSNVVGAVLLPSYSGLVDDPARRRELHFRAVALGAGLNLLFLALVIPLGGPFLHAVYGSKWDAAVGPLRILAIAGLLRALVSLSGDLLVGAGRPGSYRAMTSVQLAAAAILIGPGLVWGGTQGVALAMAASAGLAMLVGWWVARAPLATSFRTFPSVLWPSLLAFTLTTAVASAVLAALPARLGLVGVSLVGSIEAALFVAVWWRFDSRVRGVFRPREGGAEQPA